MTSQLLIIFDGECDFCRDCVKWVKNRITTTAIENQSIDPNTYGITREQCEKSVVVIDDKTYFGAKAVAHLLRKTGHKYLAALLSTSGPIGEFGYRYVAEHRGGKLVALLHELIKRSA